MFLFCFILEVGEIVNLKVGEFTFLQVYLN